MLVLSIPTRNQHVFVFNRLLPSVLWSTRVPDVIHLWDNSDGGKLTEYANTEGNSALYDATLGLELPHDVKYIVEGRGTNTALSAVWNYVITKCDNDDTIILANDDIVFFDTTIELLEKSTADFAFPAGARAGNSFSLFKIKKSMWLDVGPFDHNFYPAYYEDNDYHYRMKLKGYDITPIHEAEYNHVGSATIKKYTEQEIKLHHAYHRRNAQYYMYKWGGMPGKEKYTQPFNGMDYDSAVRRFAQRVPMP